MLASIPLDRRALIPALLSAPGPAIIAAQCLTSPVLSVTSRIQVVVGIDPLHLRDDARKHYRLSSRLGLVPCCADAGAPPQQTQHRRRSAKSESHRCEPPPLRFTKRNACQQRGQKLSSLTHAAELCTPRLRHRTLVVSPLVRDHVSARKTAPRSSPISPLHTICRPRGEEPDFGLFVRWNIQELCCGPARTARLRGNRHARHRRQD